MVTLMKYVFLWLYMLIYKSSNQQSIDLYLSLIYLNNQLLLALIAKNDDSLSTWALREQFFYKSDIWPFTFSSLFPLIGSNFTLMGSFLLLDIGGVGGVGVGETKFCKSRFGGGSVGWTCCVVPFTCLTVVLSFLDVSSSWFGCNIVWTGDWRVWLWCNWCDFNKWAKINISMIS